MMPRAVRWVGRLTAGVAVALSTSCERTPDGSDAPAATERPEHVTQDLRVVETADGRRVWVLEAERAVEVPDSNLTVLTDITLYFYDRDGHLESTLTAREGEADRETRHLVSRRDVVVETREGYLLETEVLEWDNGRKKILSDRPVRITQGRNVYTGVGLISDPGLESFEILEDFRGRVLDDDGGESGGGQDDAP